MRADELATLVERSIRQALDPLVSRLTILEGQSRATAITLAAFESWRPTPGPPGPTGPAGKDGAHGRDGLDGLKGLDGKDGAPGMQFCGIFDKGAVYGRGDVVTWNGSMWHRNEGGIGIPGDTSGAWTLVVKHGRDGRDLRDSKGA